MSSELPHGAFVDSDRKTISLPMGSIVINFTFEEWLEFVEIIDDINLVFKTNLDASIYQCPSCGTAAALYEYSEPENEEIN